MLPSSARGAAGEAIGGRRRAVPVSANSYAQNYAQGGTFLVTSFMKEGVVGKISGNTGNIARNDEATTIANGAGLRPCRLRA